MTGTINAVFGMLGASRTSWRRTRNLRAGARQARAAAAPGAGSASRTARAPLRRLAAPAVMLLFVLAGAAVITFHARLLADDAAVASDPAGAAALQPALPGVSFRVGAEPGITLAPAGTGALVIAQGMRAEAPLRIDLCAQQSGSAGGRLLPLHVGYRFADVARWVGGAPGPVALRNVALAAPGSTMPRIDLAGSVAPGAMLTLRWDGGEAAASWIGDASGGRITSGQHGQVALGREGWLAWNGNAALHFARSPAAGCPGAGGLVLQLFRAGAAAPASRAMVTAFPAHGAPVTARLAPGDYRVPAAPAPAHEDEALFDQLRAHDLVRVGANGMLELAPPDLAAWLDAPPAARTRALPGWENVRLDTGSRKLLDRLYRHADGDYVREQVRVFNGERQLLAWRVADGVQGSWQASVNGAPAATAASMPASMARLFDSVAQGWGPWTRIAAWPAAGTRARITLALARPATGGESVRLLLAGRVGTLTGASLRQQEDACTGRACPSPDAVRVLDLAPAPGARSVTLDVAPLDMGPLAAPGDQQYRHLRVAGGRVEWQPLARGAHPPRPVAAPVELVDRNGAPLWSGGEPSAAAARAGLAPLLGLRAGHANSIAGMLARLPSAAGAPHRARLALDLGLQAAAQAALDCIGMRHGRWDGARCSGGAAAPIERKAGVVVIDTETGDLLAAAGAQAAQPDPAHWDELRDFDRADPARSPLRLPALQHDGGANSSPGSTFKVISALGLELAAQRDSRLDALLGGLPLDQINRIASAGGFAFRTDAPAYPERTRLAHITNFRGESLDNRTLDGRLGLAQALTYSLNTWFAWAGELSDRSLFGRPDGGAPDLQALEPDALDGVRPIVAMARRLGFGQPLRLDGGLLPEDYAWSPWDALQGTPAGIDPIHSRHELRQMTIGLRMQATPLQMALAAGAVGQGRTIAPRLLLALDGRQASASRGQALGVRLDRIRAGMKGVVDTGTAAGAFRGAAFDTLRRGLYGKTGTAPTGTRDAAGHELATVWFTGWLEPGSIPGQAHRLALAAYVSHSDATGGEHAAPIVAAILKALQARAQKSP